MHAVVGTAVGGQMTLVGEPQNLIIGQKCDWTFMEYLIRVLPVSVVVAIFAISTCIWLEHTGRFGFGNPLPRPVREVLQDVLNTENAKQSYTAKTALVIQVLTAIWLVLALALHLSEVGIIGLTVIIFLTTLNGVTDPEELGEAFVEALPFCGVIVVIFAVAAVIETQDLFQPIIDGVLGLDGTQQMCVFFLLNGVLSSVSDNVFVATIFFNEVEVAHQMGRISRERFDLLAVATNVGTNIPSIATPNGQAAFLFLLTSNIAPLLEISYGRMVWMALPYTITMSLSSLFMVTTLPTTTSWMIDLGMLARYPAINGTIP
jgi:NhaB family Na+:H+ antiporter